MQYCSRSTRRILDSLPPYVSIEDADILFLESLSLRYYPTAITKFLKRRIPQSTKSRSLSYCLVPISNNILKGAQRKDGYIIDLRESDNEKIYGFLSDYLGADFSEAELRAIVWLAHHSDSVRIERARVEASRYRARSACYIKAIIEKEASFRPKERKRYKLKDFSEKPTSFKSELDRLQELKERRKLLEKMKKR